MSMMKFKYTDHDCAYEAMSKLSHANMPIYSSVVIWLV